MTVAAALSKRTRLAMTAVGTSATFDKYVTARSMSPNCSEAVLDTAADVNFGTRTHLLSRARNNQRVAQPSFGLKPTVGELGTPGGLLEWICGGTPTGTTTLTYPLAEAAAVRRVLIDDTVKTWDVTKCAVDRAVFSARQGAELLLDLDCVGEDWSDVTAFPGGYAPDATPPFLLNDLGVTVGGVTVAVEDVRVTVEHSIARDRYFNSKVLAGAVAMDRRVTVEFTYPWGAYSAIFDDGIVDAGVAVVCTFAYNAKVFVLSMPTVRAMVQAPDVQVPAELKGRWAGQAFSNTAGGELLVQLTP